MDYRDLKVGMTVFMDSDFTCMESGPHIVHYDEKNEEFYVFCSHGKHYLSGQTSTTERHGELSGVNDKPFDL